MHTHMHTRMHTHMHTQTQTDICTRTHMHTHTDTLMSAGHTRTLPKHQCCGLPRQSDCQHSRARASAEWAAGSKFAEVPNI